jgi:hypothetical protein
MRWVLNAGFITQILLGIWFFGGWPVAAPQWGVAMPEVEADAARAQLGRWLFHSIMVMVAIIPWMWIGSAVARRTTPWAGFRLIANVVLQSKRGKFIAVVLTSLVGLHVWGYVADVPGLNPYELHIMTVMVFGALGIILMPLTAIVLGSSTPETFDLLETIGRWLFPLRQVALLHGFKVGIKGLLPMWSVPESNLRTANNDWLQSVRAMVEVTRLVIIDTRTASEGVVEEVEHMLHPDRIFRALSVTHNDGRAPALDCIHRSDDVPVLRCTYRSLPGELARFHL